MKLLLTAFEPFDDRRNSSLEVLKVARRGRYPRCSLATAVLRVDAKLGPRDLIRAIRKHDPDAVLSLGQAHRRAFITVERVAINLLDFRRADNAGARIVDRPIVPDGPAAYFATLPVRAMCEAMIKAGVPAELSQDAGSYLCNQILYTALHHAATERPALKAAFIHLPMLPAQVSRRREQAASMSVETMAIGVAAAIGAITKGRQLRSAAGGPAARNFLAGRRGR